MKIETTKEIMLRRVPSQTFSGCCKDRLYLSFLRNPEAPCYFKGTTCVSNIRKGWTWFHKFSVTQAEKVLRVSALIITESREREQFFCPDYCVLNIRHQTISLWMKWKHSWGFRPVSLLFQFSSHFPRLWPWVLKCNNFEGTWWVYWSFNMVSAI